MVSKISVGTSGEGLMYDSFSFMIFLGAEIQPLKPSRAKPSKTKRFKYLPKSVNNVGVLVDVTLNSCLIPSALLCSWISFRFFLEIFFDIFVLITFDV